MAAPGEPIIDEEQFDALTRMILDLYTKQLAAFTLLRELGATQQQIDTALSQAQGRVSRLPVVADLISKPDRPQLAKLERALRAIRWPG
jgi:hypothetical protein